MGKVLILLVEDNPGDAELTRQALASSRLGAELLVLDDGEKALRYLRGETPYRGAPLPDLLLLDLNLPKISGEELLAEIKGDGRLRSIPVVVFTSSDAEAEVSRCYAQGANCYVVKPTDFQSYLVVVAAIENFWLSVARANTAGKKVEKK